MENFPFLPFTSGKRQQLKTSLMIKRESRTILIGSPHIHSLVAYDIINELNCLVVICVSCNPLKAIRRKKWREKTRI